MHTMDLNDAYKSNSEKHKWWDEVHKDNINSQNTLNESHKLNKFEKLYPGVEFITLKKYPRRTDDRSTHYIDENTKVMYSYDYGSGEWSKIDKDHKYYNSHLHLFSFKTPIIDTKIRKM
jgi:hypothetical protein